MADDVDAFRASLQADLRRAESRGELRIALYLRAEIRDLSPEPPRPVMPRPKSGRAIVRRPPLAPVGVRWAS
jgi:hypothetical protein